MKNRLLLVLLSGLLLILPAGCVTDDSKTADSPITTDIATIKAVQAEQSTDIANLKDQVGKKADSTRVDALVTGGIGGTAGYSKDETYTKAEVDTKISTMQATIDSLTTKVSQLTPGTGGGSPTSEIGTVVFTNNPVSIPQILSSSTGSTGTPWIMTIVNQSTTWQYVKPVITLNISSGQTQTTVTDLIIIASGSSCSMTGEIIAPGGPTATSNFSFSPATMITTATPNIVAFPISGCNNSLGEIYIGPGQSQMINIQIQLKTAAVTLWNVSTSISSRSM